MSNSLSSEPEATDFIDRYHACRFKYDKNLFEGLDREEFELSSFTGGAKNRMTAKMFGDIYGNKAKQLNGLKDEASKNLLNDLIDLCKNLAPLQNNIIDVWSFSSQQAFINVFIDRQKDTVVASVMTLHEADADEEQENID